MYIIIAGEKSSLIFKIITEACEKYGKKMHIL